MKTVQKPNFRPDNLFAGRIKNVPKSFIREMLNHTGNGKQISFAGGLPDEKLIPAEGLSKAFDTALKKYGSRMFQYANSDGFHPLKKWIADRYKKKWGLEIPMDEMILTNGSQQAFDLLGKVFIEKKDKVIIEQPGYLGVIQSLQCFEPELIPVPLKPEGVDLEILQDTLEYHPVKLMHMVPNFQNPSGISYSHENKKNLAKIALQQNLLVVEDDPYGELYFEEDYETPPLKKYMGDNGILLGSFSKTLSPGMRLGWIIASREIIDKLIIAKQASDLHTNNISQMMAYEFLIENDYESHLKAIRKCYHERKEYMQQAILKYLPADVRFTDPQGGMFLWGELPEHIPAFKLVQLCMDSGVVFVPGEVFHLNGHGKNTFRLNFSKSSPEEIDQGIQIISKAIAFLNSKNKVYQV